MMRMKGEGVLMMKMKEQVECLKQWFQLYKKQLMIGSLALIVMFIIQDVCFELSINKKKYFDQSLYLL